MTYLLDTHVWLWAISEPSRLGKDTRSMLSSSRSQLYLSAVSSWEATIKWRLGKLTLPGRPEEIVEDSLARNGLLALPVNHVHGCEVGNLPDLHNDPFDRLLIAQALVEGMHLITADKAVQAYRVPTRWALD